MSQPRPCRDPRCLHWLVGLIVGGLFVLGGTANLAQLALKHIPALNLTKWVTLAGYGAALAGILSVSARCRTELSQRRCFWTFIAVSVLIKSGLVIHLGSTPQTADRLFLFQFVERWAAGGGEALRQLSLEYYDYPLWTGRAWPFLYPLRMLFPKHFITAVLWLNVGLSTLLAVSIYALLKPVVARPLMALGLALFAPHITWQVLEFGYQFQGALLLVAALYVVRKLSGSPALPACHRWCWIGGLSLLCFLLGLQQGLDLIWIAVCGGLAVYEGLARRSWRNLLRAFLIYCLIPFSVSYPATKAVAHYFQRHNEGQLSTHYIGHMAMGWNVVTWGEYYAPVVAADKATPPEQKNEAMLKILKQQLQRQPRKTLFKLLVIKVIKLFQLGAVSGAEDNLRAAGNQVWCDMAVATRLVFTPFVLLLAALGAIRFFVRHGPVVFPWALMVLAFTMAYTFFSETSPRYSFYFQFVIYGCALEGISLLARYRFFIRRLRR